MKTFLALFLCAFVGLTILLSSSALYAQNLQRWEISLMNGGQALTTASVSCLSGGACDASAWTILIPGCTYKLDFSMQFSGDLVRLLLFHESLDSDCSNILLQQATGTGSADTNYPNAQTANGEVTLRYQSPIGTAGGTAEWSARRL
jgi:hypothetical protein